ncbi:hypothetical protein DC030_15085, partial [Enterococcus faecalis]
DDFAIQFGYQAVLARLAVFQPLLRFAELHAGRLHQRRIDAGIADDGVKVGGISGVYRADGNLGHTFLLMNGGYFNTTAVVCIRQNQLVAAANVC